MTVRGAVEKGDKFAYRNADRVQVRTSPAAQPSVKLASAGVLRRSANAHFPSDNAGARADDHAKPAIGKATALSRDYIFLFRGRS